MLHLPLVQLQDQAAVGVESFVFRTAVPAFAAEEVLVPGTARFHVVDADEGMELHVAS